MTSSDGIATNETASIAGADFEIIRALDPYGRQIGLSVGGLLDTTITYATNGLIATISNDECHVEYLYDAIGGDVGQVLTLSNGVTFSRSLTRHAYLRDEILSAVNVCGGDTNRYDYTYDGWRPLVETIVRPDSTTDRIDYVWGKDISGSVDGAAGIGGLLYVKLNGAVFVPFCDAYGNIMGYRDAEGNVVASYTYDAFGRTVAQNGTMADMFAIRCSTKYYDAEVGLYYYGKRHYSPVWRRWLTRDPIGEEGGANLYGFVGNNPLLFQDAEGTSSFWGPTPFDQFGNNTDPLGEEKWFEKHYSGWLTEARKRFSDEINRHVDCAKDVFNGPSSRISVRPSINRGGSTTRQTAGGNERDFGDAGQSDWFADKVLGQFTIDYVTPVKIKYDTIRGRRKYSWTTEMYIEDVLGTQPGDRLRNIPGVAAVTPSRKVKRAQWMLSGSGECCAK